MPDILYVFSKFGTMCLPDNLTDAAIWGGLALTLANNCINIIFANLREYDLIQNTCNKRFKCKRLSSLTFDIRYGINTYNTVGLLILY